MSESLSDVVWRYFQRRGTYPLLVNVRHGVDDRVFDTVYVAVKNAIEDADAVDLLDMVTTDGEYWSGILLELSSSHYKPDNSPDTQLEASLRREKDGQKMVVHLVNDIVREYDIKYRAYQVVSGSDEVSIRSSLTGLGRGYFSEPSRI